MIKAITGTKDILSPDIRKWRRLEELVHSVMGSFRYSEIRTPVFEETRLFSRGIGEATDIVSKEMYTFKDRSDTSLTLKPEMTAAVVRAFIEHSLGKKNNLNKLYYISPMFRQERPQAGRFRQFHQFGAEAIGSGEPTLDAEMIILANDILKNLGLKNLTVKINSLGVPESREKYKSILRDYLKPSLNKLSEESRKRFETNILRIFDSKEEADDEIMENAPLLIDHLDQESFAHFEEVKKLLDSAGIIYETDPKLVRGLDYYTNTTFEIVSGSVGAQSALCGGGRYDLLIEQLGGNAAPGVGFAAGIERILLACENEGALQIDEDNIQVYVVRLDKNLSAEAYKIALTLRRKGTKVELDYLNRSVKAQMREANRLSAKIVLMIGGEEFANGKCVMKNMSDGEQREIPLTEIPQLQF